MQILPFRCAPSCLSTRSGRSGGDQSSVRRVFGAVLTGLLLLYAAGPNPSLAQDAEDPAAQEIDEVIDVRFATFRYHPDTLRIPIGQTVKLVFHNEGDFEHEFTVGRNLTDDRRGYKNDLFEGVDIRKSKTARGGEDTRKRPGLSITVAPDSTQSLTFRLPAAKQGEWEMGCFLTDPALHYDAGMKGTVLVE